MPAKQVCTPHLQRRHHPRLKQLPGVVAPPFDQQVARRLGGGEDDAAEPRQQALGEVVLSQQWVLDRGQEHLVLGVQNSKSVN